MTTTRTLDTLTKMVEELSQTSSSNEKKTILKKYSSMQKILRYTFTGFKKYNITSKNLIKNKNLISNKAPLCIFSLLDKLDAREVTGNEAISYVNGFIQKFQQYEQLIHNIIDRNLKCRINTSLINKVYPNLIKTFDVALANKFNGKLTEGSFFVQKKLDGCRCITIIRDGNISFYSRSGKEFTTLDKLKVPLIKSNIHNAVIDGEICILDKDGNENFQDIIKLIKKKDYTIENPSYIVFDILTLDEFESGKSATTYFERFESVKALCDLLSSKHFKAVEVVDKGNSSYILEKIPEYMTLAKKRNLEGLILRKDVPYEGKRTNDLLKLKEFNDIELIIAAVSMGPIRYIKDGKEITENMLSNVSCYLEDGSVVNVGSGFSIEERQHYYKYSKELIGKTVTVKYFERTTNQQGGSSLRFPTIKHIYKNGRNT